MGIFFSRSSTNKEKSQAKENPSIDDKDRATLQLKRTRDKLRKSQETTRNVISRESKIARELLNKGMKDRAITVLKKKKYQETLLERAEKTLLNVEQMLLDLNAAVEMKKVFDALSQGNNCLRALQEDLSIDKIDKLMQDTEEAVQLHEDMSNTLSTNISVFDMGEIDDNLDELMKEFGMDEETEKPLDIEDNLPLPPTKKLSEQITEEIDDELDALIEESAPKKKKELLLS